MSRVAVGAGAGGGGGWGGGLRLGRAGWGIALIGRTKKTLDETAALGKSTGVIMAVFVGDVGEEHDVERMAGEITRRLGEIEALINCAGTNLKKRSIAETSVADFDSVMKTN